AGTPAVLKGVTPEQITHLAVHHDGQPVVVLDRQGSGWMVAPGWPANPEEVQTVLDLVTHLHSRFAPVRADSPAEMAHYGLERPALLVEVRWKDGKGADKATLALGEAAELNRFVRPTYLRLDGSNEVLQLAPGLIGVLRRPAYLYRQRRLFP